MNLLFTEQNFSARFRDLTGYPDADIPFAKIKPSLEFATYEIIELISFSDASIANWLHPNIL